MRHAGWCASVHLERRELIHAKVQRADDERIIAYGQLIATKPVQTV